MPRRRRRADEHDERRLRCVRDRRQRVASEDRKRQELREERVLHLAARHRPADEDPLHALLPALGDGTPAASRSAPHFQTFLRRAAYPFCARCVVLLSLGAVALVSLGVFALNPVAPVLSLGVLYLFAVLPVAALWGLRYAVPVSIVSMLAFNWFFLPPTHTLQLRDSENWVALAVYLVTAVSVSGSRARAAARARGRGEDRCAALRQP